MKRRFDGQTYQPELDFDRLNSLYDKVWDLMKDGQWRTLKDISLAVGNDNYSSISARLGDFRKPRNGGHTVNKRRAGDPSRGFFEYQLVEKIREAKNEKTN